MWEVWQRQNVIACDWVVTFLVAAFFPIWRKTTAQGGPKFPISSFKWRTDDNRWMIGKNKQTCRKWIKNRFVERNWQKQKENGIGRTKCATKFCSYVPVPETVPVFGRGKKRTTTLFMQDFISRGCKRAALTPTRLVYVWLGTFRSSLKLSMSR